MAILSYPGVYVEEISSGVRPIEAASTSTAAFVGLTERGSDNEARRITSWTEFQKYYGTFINDSYLAQSVFQYFNNGGRQCYIVRITCSDAEKAEVTAQNGASPPADTLKFSAKDVGAWGNSVCLQIEKGTDDPKNEFKISVRRQAIPGTMSDPELEKFLEAPALEVHDNLSMDPSASNYVVKVLSRNSVFIKAEDLKATGSPVGLRPAEAKNIQLVNGADGKETLNEQSYSAGFSYLDNKPDFSLLAVPGIGTSIMVDAGVAYCQKRPLQDVFYIGEMASGESTPDAAETFRKSLTQPNSYGAVYFPWIKALDPSGKSPEPVLLPPSGFVAGLYARIDAKRGVWKAPAGTEATLSGAVGLAIELTDIEQGNLNRINVNCIRRFPAAGIVSWGARTITSNPEYKYVPVRRMAIMLRVSIYSGIQWAVFEPNDEDLWGQLRLNIRSFMMTLFRQGAFQGATPSQAFFVKCDSETTTQDDINLGIVNVLVGFASLKPAEFVVVKISQKAGQSS